MYSQKLIYQKKTRCGKSGPAFPVTHHKPEEGLPSNFYRWWGASVGRGAAVGRLSGAGSGPTVRTGEWLQTLLASGQGFMDNDLLS